jgi:hypothetical protein
MRTSAIFAVLALAFGAAPLGWAAPPAERCGEGSGAVIKTCVDDILIVEGEIIENLDLVVEDLEARHVLQADRAGSLKDKLDLLRNAHGRAQGESDDLEEADYDEMTGAAYKKSCEWKDSFVEPPSSQDGKCDKAERKEHLCERVCELDTTGQGKKNRKKERLQDELSDALVQLEDANEALEEDLKRRALLDFTLDAEPAVCPADYSFLGSLRIPTEATFTLLAVAVAADAVRDVAERICDATKAGSNGAIVCAATEGVYHIVNTAYEITNAINNDINEAELIATYSCAEQIKQLVDQAVGDTKEAQEQITEIKKQIDSLNESIAVITNLLLTPQGRRDGFPVK